MVIKFPQPEENPVFSTTPSPIASTGVPREVAMSTQI